LGNDEDQARYCGYQKDAEDDRDYPHNGYSVVEGWAGASEGSSAGV
jgi:hypothetical protein